MRGLVLDIGGERFSEAGGPKIALSSTTLSPPHMVLLNRLGSMAVNWE